MKVFKIFLKSITKLKDKRQAAICACFLFLLAGTGLISLWLSSDTMDDSERGTENVIQFSVPSGFYENEISLQITSAQEGEIWYTLDGSVPARDNDKALRYSLGEDISLECEAEERVYIVRATLLQEDVIGNPVSTVSYVIGGQVKSRYDLPVLVIAGAPVDLLDEETGILAWKNREVRGREMERAVQITLFNEQGDVELSQNCGVRIFGNGSRIKNQPSLRLYARSEYDEENRFDYAFFENYSTQNTLLTGCKRVIVRNGGNDHGYAHLRNEFASRLSLNAGFPDAQGSSPVCVYINNEYYGVYWFVTNYDASYFERKYGEYDGEMVILEGIVALMEADEEDEELTLRMKEEYNALHETLAYADLNDPANWELLNESIDVENYLQYVAIQNYFCNDDAFQNNFKTYRYYSEDGKYEEGTVFDGRYRFLLYDIDRALDFSMENAIWYNVLATTNRVEYDIFYNALFANIVSTEEGKNYYIRYYLSLLNYYFNERQALPVLDEMHESHVAELRYLYTQTNLMENNDETPRGADFDHMLNEVEKVRNYIVVRPAWALVDLENAFGLSNRYELLVKNYGEANISVDFATFHDTEYMGTYFAEVPVSVTASPKCGDRFDYWLVDGVEYYDQTVIITGDMLQDNAITLECVTSPDPDAGLLISAVKSRGGNDYIALTNFGEQTQDLADYILADGSDEINSSTLPSLKVAPGEEVTVYCKNYTGVEAIGKPEVGFNIKAGETLHLYKDELIQKVSVPRLGTRDGVYRMDVHSGEFYENLK